jgi:hypothetical protein
VLEPRDSTGREKQWSSIDDDEDDDDADEAHTKECWYRDGSISHEHSSGDSTRLHMSLTEEMMDAVVAAAAAGEERGGVANAARSSATAGRSGAGCGCASPCTCNGGTSTAFHPRLTLSRSLPVEAAYNCSHGGSGGDGGAHCADSTRGCSSGGDLIEVVGLNDTISVARCIDLAKELTHVVAAAAPSTRHSASSEFLLLDGAPPAAGPEVASYASVHPIHPDISARLHAELVHAAEGDADVNASAGTCAAGAAALLGRLVARAVRCRCPGVYRVVVAVRADAPALSPKSSMEQSKLQTQAQSQELLRRHTLTAVSVRSSGGGGGPAPRPAPRADCYAIAVSAASWKDAVAGVGHAVEFLKEVAGLTDDSVCKEEDDEEECSTMDEDSTMEEDEEDEAAAECMENQSDEEKEMELRTLRLAAELPPDAGNASQGTCEGEAQHAMAIAMASATAIAKRNQEETVVKMEDDELFFACLLSG